MSKTNELIITGKTVINIKKFQEYPTSTTTQIKSERAAVWYLSTYMCVQYMFVHQIVVTVLISLEAAGGGFVWRQQDQLPIAKGWVE